MNEFAHLTAFLASSIGVTVLVVWPATGPAAWLRDRLLRRAIPAPFRGVLDCYICLGFWTGLLLSPVWWHLLYREPWCWFGGPMTAGLFWLILRPGNASSDENQSGAKTS